MFLWNGLEGNICNRLLLLVSLTWTFLAGKSNLKVDNYSILLKAKMINSKINAKITFRPLGARDVSLRMKWLNDPETNKFLGTRVRQGTDIEFHKKWFKKYKSDESREIFIILASGEPIGQVGILYINHDDKNASLYIIIGEQEFRGHGYGKEAIKYILHYAFKTLKLHKVWLEVHAENTNAIKCYMACGFTEEGVLKDSVLYGEGKSARYGDELRMAIFNKNSEG